MKATASSKAGSGKVNIPTSTILTMITVIFVILYVLSPVDLIPDFIPGIGWVDDMAVIGVGGALVMNQWR